MQNPNQFQQTVVKGMSDLRLSPNVIPCRVASNEAAPLVAGQKVKLVDVGGGAIIVTAITADTDPVFGVVLYNLKQSGFKANEAVEIASFHSVVYCESSAAIARGAKVMPVVAGQKVATLTSGKTLLGLAIDKATAADQLIRVFLLEAGAEDSVVSPQPNIAKLEMDVSATYVEVEVQAIADKIDAVIDALVASGVIQEA